MGIFDTFKSKKSAKTPETKKHAAPAKQAKSEVKEETVLTPDGKLTTVAKRADSKSKAPKVKKEDTGQAYHVLIRAHITEKASYLAGANQYVFDVEPHANKIEITKAIHKLYGVTPVKVTVMNVRGKDVKYGRSQGRTKGWRKAMVSLPAGQKIQIQEGL